MIEKILHDGFIGILWIWVFIGMSYWADGRESKLKKWEVGTAFTIGIVIGSVIRYLIGRF